MKPKNKKIKPCTEITLRDYFAAAALNGLCSKLNDCITRNTPVIFAKSAYKMADEMLRESNRKPK